MLDFHAFLDSFIDGDATKDRIQIQPKGQLLNLLKSNFWQQQM